MSPTPEAMAQTAIKNVHIFDGNKFSDITTVFVNDGKITLKEADCKTITVDGAGGYLIPGLIDCHTHVLTQSSLEEITSYGVTTVLNMARRVYPSGDELRNKPGLASWLTAGIPAVAPRTTHARLLGFYRSNLITSTDQVPQVVSEAFSNGSDYYKIIAAAPNGVSREIQNSLVEAIHHKGKKSMTHAADLESFKQAIESKTDSIQHLASDGLLTQEMIAQIASQGQSVTPTMIFFKITFQSWLLKIIRGSTFSKGNYDRLRANVRALHEAGVPVLAGSDSVGANPIINLPHGIMLHQELENLVDAGFTPAEALRAATSQAAKFHDLDDRGVIEEGRRADLVLLQANPLDDITNTRLITHIWSGGVLFQKTPRYFCQIL